MDMNIMSMYICRDDKADKKINMLNGVVVSNFCYYYYYYYV